MAINRPVRGFQGFRSFPIAVEVFALLECGERVGVKHLFRFTLRRPYADDRCGGRMPMILPLPETPPARSGVT